MNELGDNEERISPAAIARCDLCEVDNFAIGGRSGDGKFHSAYVPSADMRTLLPKRLGRGAWCGKDAPELFLRLFRIVCTPVTVLGPKGDEKLNLCRRCARQVLTEKVRDTEERAA